MFSLLRENLSTSATEVDFVAVPQYDAQDLDYVFGLVDKRVHKRGRSYGAFILRSASTDDVVEIVKSFSSNASYARGRTYQSQEYTSISMNDTTPLHTDISGLGSRANDITLHYTTSGAADFIFLSGSRTPDSLARLSKGISIPATNRLFDEGILEDTLASAPRIALRSEIHTRDLVIFDSTQPHAFRSETGEDPRISEAHFFVPN